MMIAMGITNVRSEIEAPQRVEVTVRGKWTFLLNHSEKPQTVKLSRSYKDALKAETVNGSIALEPYDARVLSY